MHVCRTLLNVLLLLGLLIAVLASPTYSADTPQAEDTVQPSPALSPAAVIKIQLEALGKNDEPHENAGIETAFRFASPSNKRATGPLERFIRMVSSPAYRPMLNHRKARYGKIEIVENRARQSVVLTAQDGKKIGYVFTLSKQQDGQYDGCWMTDGVSPFDPQEEPEEPLLSI